MDVENNELQKSVTVDPNFIDFEFGDLYVKCGCGYESLEIPGLQGLQILLPATNVDKIHLVCRGCGANLTMFYKESANKEELRNQVELEKKVNDEINLTLAQLKELEIKEKEENGSGIVESA
jgi:hypothetical protein